VHLRAVVPDDIERLAEIGTASNEAGGVPRAFSATELAEELDDDRIALATDTRVAVLDDTTIGFAYTYLLPASHDLERCYVLGSVDPAHRCRGAGRALLAWGVARARERFVTDDRQRVIRVDAPETDTSRRRLHERMGFVPVRWFEELLRPLDPLPPQTTVEGLRIEPWPDDRDDEIRAARDASFADHWGSSPMDPTDWHVIVRGHGARPDLSFVGVDAATGAVVAHCINHRYEEEDEMLGRREAWIENLGTVPAWRGRGVATALIAASMHAFAGAGATHAALGVDAESLTGAGHLYTSLGFALVRRSVTSEIAVS
jgi:GNAT superfamily N-acetyltransferase